MLLTDKKVKLAKALDRAYKLSDGRGLYVLVKPSGGKYWRFKYRAGGKEKLMAFGVYPDVSLAEARERLVEARKVLAAGTDPGVVKRVEKQQQLIRATNSLEAVSREWHENKKLLWTSNHAQSVLRRLELDIFPTLGHRPIQEITAPELLAVLRKVESRGALDISHRLCQTCGQVFRYAIASGRAERDPAADLRGALKTAVKKHYKHLSAKELPDFLERLSGYQGDIKTKLGFQLLLLTFVRTGELRAAEWSEIDWEAREWRIAGAKMKMRRQHIIPLSDQALAILQELKLITGHGRYIFPSQSNFTRFMSENTLLYAFYRMGYHSRATVHGFRATASTTLNEMGFRPDVIERQLAHAERNKVRASYNHAEYLPERRKMMQYWADYLTTISNSNSNIIIG